jgi:hypothetical protein
MFAQPHFGFAKGSVFVTHQAQNGQKLRLIELVLAETAAVTRKHRLGDLQGDASKGQESDFGHRASCLSSKQQIHGARYLEFFIVVTRMSTEPIYLYSCTHRQTVNGTMRWSGHYISGKSAIQRARLMRSKKKVVRRLRNSKRENRRWRDAKNAENFCYPYVKETQLRPGRTNESKHGKILIFIHSKTI